MMLLLVCQCKSIHMNVLLQLVGRGLQTVKTRIMCRVSQVGGRQARTWGEESMKWGRLDGELDEEEVGSNESLQVELHCLFIQSQVVHTPCKMKKKKERKA